MLIEDPSGATLTRTGYWSISYMNDLQLFCTPAPLVIFETWASTQPMTTLESTDTWHHCTFVFERRLMQKKAKISSTLLGLNSILLRKAIRHYIIIYNFIIYIIIYTYIQMLNNKTLETNRQIKKKRICLRQLYQIKNGQKTKHL